MYICIENSEGTPSTNRHETLFQKRDKQKAGTLAAKGRKGAENGPVSVKRHGRKLLDKRSKGDGTAEMIF